MLRSNVFLKALGGQARPTFIYCLIWSAHSGTCRYLNESSPWQNPLSTASLSAIQARQFREAQVPTLPEPVDRDSRSPATIESASIQKWHFGNHSV
jgi:hypothetical protein